MTDAARRGTDLAIGRTLLEAAATEMGVVLQRTALSPNIKERRDHSCALFDATGALLAQAEHMPVHLGAMQASVHAALAAFPDLADGDAVVLNDPFHGGTHLPDLTMVTPVFARGDLIGYAGNRAHHADVGGMVPGSMPANATEVFQEGLIVPPVKFEAAGRRVRDVERLVLANVRTPRERRGDLNAQFAANVVGAKRLRELAARHGTAGFLALAAALLDASERAAAAAFDALPAGSARAQDVLEGDGVTPDELTIAATVTVGDGRFTADFAGTSPAGPGNLNAPLPVAFACAAYVALTLVGSGVMANAGLHRRVTVDAPVGSLLNPLPPAAVAAGNVETSQRTVDVLYRALAAFMPERVPAASQGTMNNVTLGGRGPSGPFTFYETVAGGQGASATHAGMSGVHTHLTNTRNTPIEALEHAFPLRVERYGLRPGTGGAGARAGGDGVERALRVLVPGVVASLITDRRVHAPWGVAGGTPGAVGENVLERDGVATPLAAKAVLHLEDGDVLVIRTPGGGAHGAVNPG